MELGLSTLLFPQKSPEEGVKLAKELGLDLVEVTFDVPHFSSEFNLKKLKNLKEVIESSGMKARVHGRFWDLNSISHYAELRKITKNRGKESIESCALLDGDVVTVHPGRCWSKENKEFFQKCKNWFDDYVEELSSSAQKQDVKIAIENGVHPADYPREPEDLIQAGQDRKGVGITLDVGHANLSVQDTDDTREEKIVDLIKRFGEDLINVHLHDNHGEWDEHLPPNKGEIDFKPIIEALEKYYDGPIILELWNPSNPRKVAEEGVEYLKDQYSKFFQPK